MEKKKQGKPVYETPKVMRLDDSTWAIGGTSPSACQPSGSSAADNCRNGSYPGQGCDEGNVFNSICDTGSEFTNSIG